MHKHGSGQSCKLGDAEICKVTIVEMCKVTIVEICKVSIVEICKVSKWANAEVSHYVWLLPLPLLQVHGNCYKYTVTATKECRILEWERGNSLDGKDSLNPAHLIQSSAQLSSLNHQLSSVNSIIWCGGLVNWLSSNSLLNLQRHRLHQVQELHKVVHH